jgi:hypothetical protein
MFTFATVLSGSKISCNETYGEDLRQVRVNAHIRQFPYKGVDRIEVYDAVTGKLIPLDSLNKFEQENLIDEANAELRYLNLQG